MGKLASISDWRHLTGGGGTGGEESPWLYLVLKFVNALFCRRPSLWANASFQIYPAAAQATFRRRRNNIPFKRRRKIVFWCGKILFPSHNFFNHLLLDSGERWKAKEGKPTISLNAAGIPLRHKSKWKSGKKNEFPRERYISPPSSAENEFRARNKFSLRLLRYCVTEFLSGTLSFFAPPLSSPACFSFTAQQRKKDTWTQIHRRFPKVLQCNLRGK